MNIKKIKTFLILLSFLAYMPLSCLQVLAAPNLDGAVGGSVTQNGNETLIQVGNNIKGSVSQFDWKDFNVNSNETVNWFFTNYSQTAINRVLGNNPSFINGILKNSSNADYHQTGRVIFINPSGILFGSGSSVNLNSFTASTFDIKGIKDVKDGQTVENLRQKYGYNIAKYDTNGVFEEYVSKIEFEGRDFDTALNPYAGLISADNASITANNSLIFAAKDIKVYNGSVLKTNLNYNLLNYPLNYSNIKLVTADGVNFEYKDNGYVRNASTEAFDGKIGVDYNILLQDAYLTSGDIYIKNAGMTYSNGTNIGSDIKIERSQLKGYKLVDQAFGDIYIVGNNFVDIKDSILATKNTYYDNGPDTYDNWGGNITIKGGQRVNIKNSDITTEYSTDSTKASGDVNIEAKYGYVWMDETYVDARGNINVAAKNDVKIADTVLTARNANVDGAKDIYKTINITGSKVDLITSAIDASSDITILARILGADGSTILSYGDVNITGTKSDGTEGQNLLNSGGTLNIFGKNTDIDRSVLSFYSLKLFDDVKHPALVNNVTIKNDTAFGVKQAAGANPDDNHLAISTNGNLTVDNTSLKAKNIKLSQEGGRNKYTAETVGDQNLISLNSTKGNVTVKGASDIAAAKDIAVTANQGNISVEGISNLVSGAKVNIAAGNNVVLKEGSIVVGTTNASVTGKNVEIINSAVVATAGDATVTATTDNVLLNNGVVASEANVNITAANNVTIQNASEVMGVTGASVTGQNVEINNSAVKTITSGNVAITATTGNVLLDKATIASAANVNITAGNNVTIQNTSDVIGKTGVKTSAKSNTINNSKLTATTGNVDVTSTTGGIEINKGTIVANAGNVNLTAKTAGTNINITNGSLLDAGSALNILGQNTLLENSNMTYNTISLYDGSVTNNVTIKGSSQITDKQGPLALATNGNLTIDANKLQKIGGADQSAITLTGKDVTFQNASDVTTAGNFLATASGKLTVKDASSIKAANLTTKAASTEINNSKLEATGKAKIESTTGNTVIDNASTVKAGGDVEMIATNGIHTIKGASSVASTSGDVHITQSGTFIAQGDDSAGIGLGTNSTISGKNVNIKTTAANSDIKMNPAGMSQIAYTGRLKLDAGHDVTLSSGTSWNLSKVDMIAGNTNTVLANNGDVTLKDVTMSGTNNNITASKNVYFDNDVVVNKGITNVTATSGDVKTINGSNLNMKQNKLKVNAGNDVNLLLAGVNNVNAGIEVKAGLQAATGTSAGTTTLKTVNNEALSIARIITNNLTLDESGTFLAAKDVNLTAQEIANINASTASPGSPANPDLSNRAYIEVKNYGGFNFDGPSPTPVPSTPPSDTSFYQGSYDPMLDTITGEALQYNKHIIDLNKQGGSSSGLAVLVYARPGTGYTPPPPETDPSIDGTDFLNDIVKIPQQADMLGTAGPIINNLSDPLPGMVAAAAGITLEDDEDDLF